MTSTTARLAVLLTVLSGVACLIPVLAALAVQDPATRSQLARAAADLWLDALPWLAGLAGMYGARHLPIPGADRAPTSAELAVGPPSITEP